MSIKMSVITDNEYGMTIVKDTEVPMLVENNQGVIGLLIKYDKNGYHDEADILLLSGKDIGRYIERGNLEYWRPYKKAIRLENL